MSHRPRKRFGQHFLTAPEIVDQIVAAVSPQNGDIIVEIGSGRAAITAPLAALATTLHAIELDRDLVAALRVRFAARDNVIIHEADALTFDFASLGDALRIVGNLPYNISTPLLFHLLQFSDHIVDAHFMLQKEVVDRLCAEPGSRAYGRLTVMLGCRLQVLPLFEVPPEAFTPSPKVRSAVARLRPFPESMFDIRDKDRFAAIVKLAFSRRRKTLRNALQGLVDVTEIEAAGLDAGCRPEQVPIAGWVALANGVD